MGYNIELEIYKGPMNLLCHLIEKNKIDIYDIPIHLITEQYIDYVQRIEEMDLDITSEFILMSATLIEIKSKMLLPKKEDDDIEDPRDELVQKIVEYKKIKTVLEELKNRKNEYDKIYFKLKEEMNIEQNDDLDLKQIKIEDLSKVFLKILEKQDIIEKKQVLDIRIISKEEITIEEGLEIVRGQIINKEKNLEDILLYEDNITKNKIIVLFLAILELIKRKEIKIIEKNNENHFRIIVEG